MGCGSILPFFNQFAFLIKWLEHVEHSQQSHPLTNKSQSYCTFITHQ
ncbi:hypothetical protein [Moraxella lacunata]